MDITRNPTASGRFAGGRAAAARPDVRPQGRRQRLHGLAAPPPAARPGRGPRRRAAGRVHRDLLAAARGAEPQPGHSRSLRPRVVTPHPPRLGDYGVRELTPKRLMRFRAELERAGVGTATVVKAMTIVQSILRFAVSEELVEYNAAAGVTKPRYERAREPHIFLPAEVEAIRAQLGPARPHARLGPRVLGAPARGGRLPPRLERRRRARDPLPSTPSATAPGTRRC